MLYGHHASVACLAVSTAYNLIVSGSEVRLFTEPVVFLWKLVCKLVYLEKLSSGTESKLCWFEAYFFIFTTVRHQFIMRQALSWWWIASQCRCRSTGPFMSSGYFDNVFITFISCRFIKRTELESVCLSVRPSVRFCVFVSLSVHLCLSVCLSVCLAV